jgi:prolyl-tRNA synthetase
MINNCLKDVNRLNKRNYNYNHRLNKLKIRVHFDNRDNYSPGWKFNKWE